MISTSIKSKPSGDRPVEVKNHIRHAMQQCRRGTLKLFENMEEDTLRRQAHPDFSPVGWHLGHIGFTEGLWLLERCAGKAPLFPQYRRLMAQDGLPKHQRVELPPLPEILDYIQCIREQVFAYLDSAPIERQETLWRFILQHECQHTETIAFLLQLQRSPRRAAGEAKSPELLSSDREIEIPAGECELGSDAPEALDNERSAHRQYLPAYLIDRYPVTCGEFRQFIDQEGYHTPRWWSSEGWEWRQTHQVTQPLYWNDKPGFENHPVCGVSYYEAEAYARFVGKRLPTEAEWEKAASWDPQTQRQRTYPWGDEFPTGDRANLDNRQAQTTPVNAYPAGMSAYGCYDMLGNVWEWTSSWFLGYSGFQPYPYPGYSQAYFDREHRVLRGGSWTTRPWAMRCSFRNWYYPWVRQIFAGFRCARDLQ